jgi:Fe-S cluster assembly protein SufD
MIKETPQIVIRTKDRNAGILPDFKFTPDLAKRDGESGFILDFHKAAWDTYQSLPMPTLRDEPWRRTDLKGLRTQDLILATQATSEPPQELIDPLIGEKHGGQIILTANGAKVTLDEDIAAKGVIFTDLKTAEEKYPDYLEKILGKVVSPSEGKFAALAAALAQNGVFLYIPKGVEVDLPFHSLLWGSGTNTAYLSHLLIYLEEGASATYMHEAASVTEVGQSMHAGNVEIYVGPSASLKFVELQSWGQHVWNFSHERVRVEQNGKLEWIFGAIGSKLTKNFSTLDLAGEGAEGRISGFYFTDHQQHLDHDTQQNHLAPHTTSDLIFKGALSGESRSVWQGMIYVAKEASKTDGYQANRNLILSPKARADSIPGLEILTDDVRCTHGATVGQVDPEQVFYIISRGIPKREAEQLIVEGFFEQIMQRIPFEGVKQRFEDAIHQKMKALLLAF